MSLKSILDNLINETSLKQEFCKNETPAYEEVFKNPDMGEVRDIINVGSYIDAKIGIDFDDNIFVWVNDIMHTIMEEAVEVKFKLKFNYTQGNSVLFLAKDISENQWREYSNNDLNNRLKNIFPKIITIRMVSNPFSIVQNY